MNWLSQVLERLFCWFPRLWIINPDESGVRITLGKHTKECPPGWYWFLPLIHTKFKVNTSTQGVRFAIQSVTTKDDQDVAIRGAVLYRINNAYKALFETNDFDQSLEAVAGGVIEAFVASKTYDELRDRETIRTELAKALRAEAAGWGIRLLRVYVPDIGRVRNIRVLSDSTQTILPFSQE